MVFIQAQLDRSDTKIIHVYLTSFYRKDMKEQLDQCEEYGIIPLRCKDRKSIKEIKSTIKNLAAVHRKIIIHLDESDFGTGEDQNLAPLYEFFVDRTGLNQLKDKIRLRLYSATNEEARYSRFAEQYDVEIMTFVPPPTFRGPEWYLDENLVYQAEPFYDYDLKCLTAQGLEVVEELKASNKALAIVRLTGKSASNDDSNISIVEQDQGLINYLSDRCIQAKFIYARQGFNWEKDWIAPVKLHEGCGLKTIIFLNQKAVRSTELHCHAHVALLHDYRKESTTYSTAQQAALRVCHYDEVGHKIKVYSDPYVFKLAAERISMEEFMSQSRRNVSDRLGTSFAQVAGQTEVKVYSKREEIPVQNTAIIGTVSNSNKVDTADYLCKGIARGQMAIHVDGPNKNYPDSWKRLIKDKPEWIGNYVVINKNTVKVCVCTKDSVYNL